MTVIPGKNFPGQKGFPTPNTAIETSACRTFSIPASEDWLGLIMGAVSQLAEPYNYFRWGTLSPQEAADAWRDIIDAAYAQALTGQCTADVPTPWWDSATDVTAEMAVDSQIWYGKAGSFVEDVSIWGFAGLIVASLGIAGIAPAIAYVTVAQKFVLAYKNDHIGATVRFFVDGFKVYEGTDLGDGTISRVKVVADPDLSTHDILATADEGHGLSIVRKELSPDQVSNPAQRYDPTCDCIQTTPDGGTTWIDTPASDPRHADALRLPSGGSGDDYLCDVAARITAQFRETVDEFLSALSISAFATVVLGFLELLSPFVGVLIDLILLIYNALVAIGTANITASFTDEVYHGIECIIRCHLATDGTLTAAAVDAIKADIFTAYPGTVSDTVSVLFTLYGEVLSSNAGVERSETGDCADCDCGPLCFVPDAPRVHQARCTSPDLYLAFDSGGCYTTVSAPNGQGAFIHLSDLVPSGIGVGWKVTFDWIGGTPTVFQSATGMDGTGVVCAFGTVNLTITSGLQQNVAADHPYVWIGWTGDGGVFHVSNICIERQ